MTLSRVRLRQLALLFAASLVLVAALYARALRYELVWMDETEIGEGAILLGPGESWASAFTRSLHRGAGVNPYYRPLQILVATGIHRVAGPSPTAYRVTLLAFAVATCTAFGALALLLFESLPLALLAMALAAAHPAMIESWVWISGLGEAMAAFFAITSIVLGLLALAPTDRIGKGLAALSMLSLVLALLSKEKAVATPLLLAVAWLAATLRHTKLRALFAERTTLRRALLLIGAQVAIVVLYVVAWRPLMLGHALVAAPLIGGDRVTHLLSAMAAWPTSFAWLAMPLHSSASDTVAIVRSFGDARVWLGLAIPFGLLAASLLCVLRGRPIAALGLLWVWLAFLPTANLFPQIHARAERYLFLSAFGAALVVVDLLDAMALRIAPRARVAVAVAIGAVLALGLAQRTWVRTPDWQSTETLFRHDVASDPDYAEGRFHLARTLMLTQRNGEAAAELSALRERRPERSGRFGYVNETGVRELECAVDLALGRRAEIVASFQNLERSAPSAAEDPGLRSCAALALEGLGRTADANALYQRVVASLATEPPAAVSLALARTYAKIGRKSEAQQWLARATRDAPHDPTFSFQLRQVEILLR